MRQSEESRKRRDKRALAREALEIAAADPDPDIERLVAAMPRVMAEARKRLDARTRLEKRRRLELARNPLAAAVPLASKAIPRFAAAALLLALVSGTILVRDAARVESDGEDLDKALLVGTDVAGVESLILGSVAPQEDADG